MDSVNDDTILQEANQLKLLLEVTNQVVSNLDFRDLMQAISSSIRHVMQCLGVGVILPEVDGNHLRYHSFDVMKGFHKPPDTPFPLETSPAGEVLRTGRPLVLNPIPREKIPFGPYITDEVGTLIELPLTSRNRTLGVLVIVLSKERPFGDSDLSFLGQVANQIAIAIENSLAYREIAELRDKLAQEKEAQRLAYEELRASRDALRRSEAYLAETQRLTRTGTYAGDCTTKPLYWSEELFRIFGYDPQHGLPTRDEPLQRIHPEDLEKFQQAFARAIHEKVDSDVEFRISLPDGTIRYLYGLGHPVLNDNGELVEVVGTVVDITERKRAEREHERLRQLEAELAHINRVSMMGELAASIAHEVNQPLSGVVSNGSACLRWLAGDLPNLEEAREAARRIIRDGKRAGEVITRIRALTRRAEMPREKLDLNETIREILSLVGDEAKKKSVIIRTQFADDLSIVSGDRVQLQQVVLNLVMNAIEAMSKVDGRPRELFITTVDIDGGQVLVSVKDSGIGVDQNTIAKIFYPFYTTKPGGMGMGLRISRTILETHGGRLWAAANNGPGATFQFSLPKYNIEGSDAGV